MSVKPDYKPVIIIPAFKRAESLDKLLKSLNRADYPGNDHHLVLSLEGNSTQEVRKMVRDFNFEHGTKEIIEHENQLGLKKHIYFCASFADQYGSIILLEDDLIVSPLYYHYAVHALRAYGESNLVAGISLYAQTFNETAQLPFIPLQTYSAAYLMQLASSWGAVWSRLHWKMYKEWRDEKLTVSTEQLIRSLPDNIQKWPESSWKKEFNIYLVDEEKYVSYPYISLTSNSSHYGGEHMVKTGSLFEVPLLSGRRWMDNAPDFPEDTNPYIRYDIFMEATGMFLKDVTGKHPSEIEMDLYGTKPDILLNRKTHFITSKIPQTYNKSYPLYRVPAEQNLEHPVRNTEDSFFYLCTAGKQQSLKTNRWGYAMLASVLGTNRILTKRFLKDSLLYFFKMKI